MGWVDALLFLGALLTWVGGAPIWVPTVLFIIAVILLCALVGGAEGLGEAIGDFIGSLF